MDVDFVLHDAPRPAADFARRAKVGGVCGISGPCGLGAKPAQNYLRAGDEAALPNVAGMPGRRVETLSGGERQRTWLAMLVAQDAVYLLLDEPISALDIGSSNGGSVSRSRAGSAQGIGHCCRFARHQHGGSLLRPDHRPAFWPRHRSWRSSRHIGCTVRRLPDRLSAIDERACKMPWGEQAPRERGD